MALILAAWVAQYFLLMGWGLWIRRIAGIGDLGDDDWFWTPWAGLFAILTFCMGWHFFAPLNGWAAAAAGFAALLGCIFNGPRFVQGFRGFWRRRNAAYWILLVCVGFICLKHATEAPKLFDSAAYHLEVVRWAHEYKLVLGLGNVNGHYAFNNVHHLYIALLDGFFGMGRSSHFAASFLWCWFFCGLLQGLFAAFQGSTRTTSNLFSAFLIPPMIVWEASVMEPASDLPSGLAVAALGLLAWDKLVWTEVASIRISALRLLWLICVVAATIKLSALAVSLAFLAFGIYVGRKSLLSKDSKIFFHDFAAPLLATCAFLLWMIRSASLSGYPLFPFGVMPLPVEWRIPEEYASWFPYWIQTFARVPFRENDLGDSWWWVLNWINGSFRGEKYMAVLPCTLLIGTWSIGAFRIKKVLAKMPHFGEAALWISALLTALGAWFLGAPAIRFGSALIWLLLAGSLALAFTAYWSSRGRFTALALFGVLVILGFADRLMPIFRQLDTHSISSALAVVWLPPGPDMGLHTLPKPNLVSRTLPSGVLFHEPAATSCPEENWHPCLGWAAPLPSAVPRLDDLAYLRPNLGAAGGFRLLIPPEGWVARYAPLVNEVHAKTNASVRALALRFRVHPNLIRQALSTPVSSRL